MTLPVPVVGGGIVEESVGRTTTVAVTRRHQIMTTRRSPRCDRWRFGPWESNHHARRSHNSRLPPALGVATATATATATEAGVTTIAVTMVAMTTAATTTTTTTTNHLL